MPLALFGPALKFLKIVIVVVKTIKNEGTMRDDERISIRIAST